MVGFGVLNVGRQWFRRLRRRIGRLLAEGLLAAALFLLGALPAAPSLAQSPGRYLIIHLDGVPADLLQREAAAGRLPALERAFAGGGRIDRALSLFPGGTEMIYPRLKARSYTAPGLPVAWAAFDRKGERVITKADNFLRLRAALPRRARYQLVEGFGRGDLTAGLVLLNLPELLQRQRVVEFFWFPTDGAGHMSGEEGQLRSLRNFDFWFGLMLSRLDQEGLNLLLYTDHGMVFSRGEGRIIGVVRQVVGADFRFYQYPNIYLKDGADPARVAAELAARPEIDFAFYRSGECEIQGLSKTGRMLITRKEGRFAYAWTGEGPDPFGYAAAGYRGQPLTADEWLELTADTGFPAVPANLGMYLTNPDAGDVVVVLNPPRRDVALLSRRAGHMGVTSGDLQVVVWYKGPDLDALAGRRTLWLHTLYQELQLDPREGAAREEQRLTLMDGAWSLSLSSAARWQLELGGKDRGFCTVRYDLWSTYLTRLWVGAGVAGLGDAPLEPEESLAFEVNIGPAGAAYLARRTPSRSDRAVVLTWELGNRVALHWETGGRAGVSLRW